MTPAVLAHEPADAAIIQFPRRTRRGGNNHGKKYPPDPLLAEDVALLMHTLEPRGPQHVHDLSAARLRALIAILHRTGVRINEALTFVEADLMRTDNALLVRHGKGDKRRIVVMDPWGWRELDRWMIHRDTLPSGYLFPVLRGPSAGGRWASCDVRRQMRDLQLASGIRKRVAPHQFRHGHAVELWREGFDVYTIQQQLGHANLNVTALYLRGVDPLKVLAGISQRKPPMVTIS